MKFNYHIVVYISGMAKTIEKYRKHSYETMDPNQSAKDLQVHLHSLSMNCQRLASKL